MTEPIAHWQMRHQDGNRVPCGWCRGRAGGCEDCDGRGWIPVDQVVDESTDDDWGD